MSFELSEKWRKVTLGETIDLKYGFGLPERVRKGGNIPVYGSSGIVGWHDEAAVKGPGIIVGRKGTIGSVYLCKSDFWPIDTTYYVELRDTLDLRFVYYLLKAQDFTYLNSDSAVPGLNRTAAYGVEVLLPPLPEQQKIASILGALDDKIELNNQMNRTLEEMASTIFKSWFVDFEPFREGEFEYNEELDKEIPKRWEVASVDELCESIVNGGTPRREVKEYWDGGTVPWIKTGELIDSVIIDSEEKITESGVKNSSAKKLPINTVLIALYASPTVGQLGILKIPATTNQACSALIAKKEVGYTFLYYTLFFQRAHLHQIAVGSAQQNISQKIVRDLRVLFPPKEILRDFNKLVGSFYNKITENSLESRNLAQIRDALLPKLLSGEIRVFDQK